MAHEQRSIPDLDPTDLEAPDIGFKAGVGFYLGLVVAGITAIGGLLAGASTEAILATTPGTVMAGLILGLVLGDRLRGLPVRFGRSRRRQAVWFLPPIAFAATLLLPAITPLAYTARVTVATLAFIALTAFVAVGVATMAHNRYVDAVSRDDPAATWTWHRTDFGFGGRLQLAGSVLMVVVGLYSMIAWGFFYGLFATVYGAMFLLTETSVGGEWTEFDGGERWNPATIRAHEAGLVVDRGVGKRLVPWDAVEDVRLTDDELVLERRWFDIRCDRSTVDDPESVLAGIERARRGVDATETVATETDTERKPETGIEPTTELESEPGLED